MGPSASQGPVDPRTCPRLIGDPGCYNGVLLLISVGDRWAYTKTARTSKAILTDRLATLVVDNMKPLMRSQRYDDAVLQAALQMYDVFEDVSVRTSGSLGGEGDFANAEVCVASCDQLILADPPRNRRDLNRCLRP